VDGLAAVVVAGGRGTRFGGGDKPGTPVGGVPMLLRVLEATAGCAPRIVVGPWREGLPADVRCVREEPPGGGPVAALAAALPLVDADLVALLAADLPALTGAVVESLATAVATADGALLVDDDGRRQLLCGVWRVGALRAEVERLGDPAGQSMRRLTQRLAVVEVSVPAGAGLPVWFDIDTREDLAVADAARLPVDRAEPPGMVDDGPDDSRGNGAHRLDQ
jgi:molybdopterin-guanine dinucleotide biosynthesis protein A